MNAPVTIPLLKIFAKGFFRANAGMLIFFFVTAISYGFFMETVGDVKLLPEETLTYYHFIIVMTFISSPLVAMIMSVIWLLYTIKSWSYVVKQLAMRDNAFIFYSVSSLKKAGQFKSWMLVQLMILLPVIIYVLFAGIFGMIFHYYLLPALIFLYVFILTTSSAFLYLHAVNRLQDGNTQSFLLRIVQGWSKPYFSLGIYQMMDRMKLSYLLTKVLSYGIITTMVLSFETPYQDVRVAGIAMLAIATSHSYILYQLQRFEETRLSLFRNMPYNRLVLFIQLAIVYVLLILPECIWLFSRYHLMLGMQALLFGIGTALFFRCSLYWSGLRMKRYLPVVFFSFIVLLYVVMFNLIAVFTWLLFLISCVIFYKTFYNQQVVMSWPAERLEK
ncbi:MAG: hypothetical protein IPO83_02980 [Chitinophagaceae bacterium]|nr:hypothetical protein [Chitinophagaceae bacterium]